jgi:transcriptional regulator with XRE-family HTH domain
MSLNIKIIREWVDRQPNQSEAARMLGMSQGTLSSLLAGNERRCNPRLDTLERFADVLRVEPGELIRRAKIV